MQKPQIEVTEAVAMECIMTIVKDAQGKEQMFICLFGVIGGEEGALILQKAPEGELCRMLTKEEVEVYSPVIQDGVEKLINERADIELIKQKRRERYFDDVRSGLAEALGIEPDDVKLRIVQ